MKQSAHIEAWQVFGDCLVGYIRNHPRQAEFTNELVQRTSRIVLADFNNGIVETQNTVYTLGLCYTDWVASLD